MMSMLARFFGWWGGELAALLPAGLRSWLGDRRLVIAVSDDGWAIRLAEGGRERTLESAHREAIETGAAAARLRMVVARLGVVDAVVVLPAAWALRKTVKVPLAAEPDLAKAIEFEIERHTPFRHDQVYAHHVILARNAGERSMDVALTTVPKAIVDSHLAVLAQAGVGPAAVQVAGDGGAPVTVLRLSRTAKSGASLDISSHGLAIACAIALIFAILSPWLRVQWEIRGLRAEADALRADSGSILARRQAGERDTALLGRIVALKSGTPPVTLVLHGLTRALPDDTYLSYLTLSGRDLTIEGVSASATALVKPIEAEPYFGKLTFTAPVTRDAGNRLDRFQFAIELEPTR